jgi:hypothetical protein
VRAAGLGVLRGLWRAGLGTAAAATVSTERRPRLGVSQRTRARPEGCEKLQLRA